MDLLTRRYSTSKSISGPLLSIKRAAHVSIGQMVRIIVSEKNERSGQVIEVSDQYAVNQGLKRQLKLVYMILTSVLQGVLKKLICHWICLAG